MKTLKQYSKNEFSKSAHNHEPKNVNLTSDYNCEEILKLNFLYNYRINVCKSLRILLEFDTDLE